MAQLRTYTVSDAAGCCAVIRACLPSLDGLDDAARAQAAIDLTPDTLHAEFGPALALVVTDQTGMVLALGAVTGDELNHLFVRPQRQREGLGTALLVALEARAQQAGVSHLHVAASPAAARFFRRRGYTGKAIVKRPSGLTAVRVVPMSKTLGG